ncbi:nodal modulator 3 isoform X3 [Manduca sexta]|uniref:nodal modulator 3 isoform X3 n=1 Tax=Manduca sexta TaxID=7130 RepID=UPI0018909341|nr:nodal modulator 3 isoform X3 [Manduca sexta]
MATFTTRKLFISILLTLSVLRCNANDIIGCGGFVKSHVSLDFSKIEIGLYTKEGSLKEKTECAPTNGYYFLPLYEKGEYVLKVHPPPGWSFEPSQVELSVDGETDQCSTGQDINFAFNGFGITGKVITAGQKQGPSGIAVQLVNDKGEVRNTITSAGGDFHFTPVIPGKYTVKASHPRWKLEPSQAAVQVKEGNTALPIGVLAVKGYDVSGSVTSFGTPINGIYVLLYSKEENPKFRVEGCNTALLQGVPDSPICHSITDASGEFNFGLVPSGEYKLLTLSTPPGQVAVSYNIRPEFVTFTVRHDSLFIKNAFEVTGFTIVGTVITSPGGKGISGARVLLDGEPVGKTDATGKFTLPSLQPSTYMLSAQHEQCEFDEVQLVVGTNGPRGGVAAARLRAARWRVCGAVTPADRRQVTLSGDDKAPAVRVTPDNEGKWCVFLPSGVYTAKVDVTEQEQRDGLQYYPMNQKVSVGNAPVDGIVFSQLKGKLSGKIQCKDKAACASIPVTLRPLSADGGYVGQPQYTVAIDGAYTFEEVLPGSVEVSVGAQRLCWADARHNVAVTQEHTNVPTFEHIGYVISLHTTHEVEVEYVGAKSKGSVLARAGSSLHCVPTAEVLQLTPRGCHRFQPPAATVDTSAANIEPVQFVAVAHAQVIQVISPEPVTDLMVTIASDTDTEDVGPLKSVPSPDGGYVFEHTMYLAEGEVRWVSARSSSLVVGGAKPVPQVTLTLTGEDDLKLTQVTTEDGTYKFGPLDASKDYVITAEKESYVFTGPDEKGDIIAHKLAEILVQLVDDADESPLQGALVSVSGGSYRRNVASGSDGALRFAALRPDTYYVKPHMKEYRFAPPHEIVPVTDGRTHKLTLRGVRVAWSCSGSLVSAAGAAWRGAILVATPISPTSVTGEARCAVEEATTDQNGLFRIRGLLPNCVYTIHLKESSNPELNGLKITKAPALIEVKDNKDITGVVVIAIQPLQITDASVLVRTQNIDHYKTLRLTLALEAAPHSPIYTTKLDPVGYNQNMNPGLMYVLPRLPADNKTYVLQLESTLSKTTHVYNEEVHYFNSDGRFKHFTIDFMPKVKSAEQELRQTSLLVIPLVIIVLVLYQERDRLAQPVAALGALAAAARARARAARPARAPRHDVLDRASIDHILTTVNAAGKKQSKKKAA